MVVKLILIFNNNKNNGMSKSKRNESGSRTSRY